MKAVAKKQFINKYSKALVKEGNVVEVSDKRFKEMNEAGYGILLVDEKEIVKEKKEKSVDKKKKEAIDKEK